MRRIAAVVAVALALLPFGAGAAGAAPVRELQWHLTALGIDQAHRLSQGDGVVVAVIDTGVSPHRDLDGQLLPGKDYEGTTDGREDLDNHGTGVAALIAARGGSADRALGIAPKAKILPVRASAALGDSTVDEAIRWATDNGARIINVSSGGQLPPETIEAVRYAFARDVVVVASAGNVSTGGGGILAPARYPGVLAATATDRGGNRWTGAKTGPEVVLSAPGVDITVPSGDERDQYVKVPGGTSASAAIVAGAAALIRARFPQAKAPDVVQRLISTADEAGAPGRDPEYGFGRLNLMRALTAEVAPVTANPLGEPRAEPPPAPAARTGSGLSGTTMAVIAAIVIALLVVVAAAIAVPLWLVTRRR